MIIGAGAEPGAAAAARVVAEPGVRLRRGKGRKEPGPRGRPGNSARFWPGRDFGAPCTWGSCCYGRGPVLGRSSWRPLHDPKLSGCTQLGVVGAGRGWGSWSACVLGKIIHRVLLPMGNCSASLLKRTSWRLDPGCCELFARPGAFVYIQLMAFEFMLS